MASPAGPGGPRARLTALVENARVQNAIIVVIFVTAVTLGLETSPAVMSVAGRWLETLDHLILAFFVINAMQSAHTSIETVAEPPRLTADIESLRQEVRALRTDLAERTVNRNPGQ